MAVIIQESGMKSPLFFNNNNPMGMKYPRIRETTAIGRDKNNFAIYNSIEEAIDDINIYFDTYIHSKNLSKSETLKFLEKNYSQEKGYADKLKKLM